MLKIQKEDASLRRRYAERPPRNSAKCTSGVSGTTRTFAVRFLCTTKSNLRPTTALSVAGAPCLEETESTHQLCFSCLPLRRRPQGALSRPAKGRTARSPLLPLLLLSRPVVISLHCKCRLPLPHLQGTYRFQSILLYPSVALWGRAPYTSLPFLAQLLTTRQRCR